MDLVKTIFGLVLTFAFAGAAIMNRGHIAFMWSPFHDLVEIPLYLIILISAALGFLFGAAVVWFNSAGLRKSKRLQQKEIKTLEREMESLNSQQSKNPPAKELFSNLLPKV